MPKTNGVAITVALMCVAHVLSLLSFAVYPTLIPLLQVEWHATNTEMGWVAGIYFGGYIIAAGVLVSLTDRFNARDVYLLSMLLGVLSAVGFAIATTGVVSASIWRCLQGVAIAGTHFPGLKALVDAVPDRVQSRTVAVYTACLGFGVATSFFVTGLLVNHIAWQWIFIVSALGPLAALGISYLFLPSVPPKRRKKKFSIFSNFKSVLKNRKVLGFSTAYSVHNVELFVFNSWIVAYLAFAFSQHEPGSFGFDWNPALIVAVVSFISQPFSILTNEIAERTNRIKIIFIVMFVSASIGIALGFASPVSIVLIVALACLYGIFIVADSASITSAVVRHAKAKLRGTTMAFHSLIGFLGAFIGPIVFGAALDITGGAHDAYSWGFAFVLTAVIVMIGPIAVYALSRDKI